MTQAVPDAPEPHKEVGVLRLPESPVLSVIAAVLLILLAAWGNAWAMMVVSGIVLLAALAWHGRASLRGGLLVALAALGVAGAVGLLMNRQPSHNLISIEEPVMANPNGPERAAALHDAEPSATNEPSNPPSTSATPDAGSTFAMSSATTALELLAISYHPSTDHPWWRPDGSPLEAGFTSQGRSINPDARGYELVFRHGELGDDMAFKLESVPPTTSISGMEPPLRDGRRAENHRLYVIHIPPGSDGGDPRTITLRMGMATGAWTTLARRSTTVGQSGAYALKDGSICRLLFGDPAETAGETRVTVSHNTLENWQTRVSVVDLAGNEHRSAPHYTAVGELASSSGHFKGLRLDQVMEFRFEVRPYRWFQFPEVALQPATGSVDQTGDAVAPQTAQTSTGRVAQFPFLAKLPIGAVEFLAIRRFEPGVTNSTWWQPDGAVSDARFAGLTGGWFEDPGRDLYELAFRVSDHTDSLADVLMECIPIHSWTGARPGAISGSDGAPQVRDKIYYQTLSCEPDLAVVSLGLGVANGPWENRKSIDFASATSVGGREGTISITVIPGEQETSVVCDYEEMEGWQSRLIARGSAGSIEPMHSQPKFRLGNTCRYTATFSTEAMKDARLELQRRAYQWVQFHNASLCPGLETQVLVRDAPGGHGL